MCTDALLSTSSPQPYSALPARAGHERGQAGRIGGMQYAKAAPSAPAVRGHLLRLVQFAVPQGRRRTAIAAGWPYRCAPTTSSRIEWFDQISSAPR